MALNPKAIKALFGKLAPMADDVAGAVANYGDDAAKLIATKGDDVLRVANKVDDFMPTNGIWKHIDDDLDEFIPYSAFDSKMPVPRFPDPKTQPLVKNNSTLNRWYDDNALEVRSLEANAPDFDYGSYLDDYYSRAPEVRHFLDTRDAVNRVQSGIGYTGTARGLNTQDLLTYTDNLSDLERYGIREGFLTDVYDELNRRYNTSKKLREQFGSVPSTFPPDQTFERALSDLFVRIEDLPY